MTNVSNFSHFKMQYWKDCVNMSLTYGPNSTRGIWVSYVGTTGAISISYNVPIHNDEGVHIGCFMVFTNDHSLRCAWVRMNTAAVR